MSGYIDYSFELTITHENLDKLNDMFWSEVDADDKSNVFVDYVDSTFDFNSGNVGVTKFADAVKITLSTSELKFKASQDEFFRKIGPFVKAGSAVTYVYLDDNTHGRWLFDGAKAIDQLGEIVYSTRDPDQPPAQARVDVLQKIMDVIYRPHQQTGIRLIDKIDKIMDAQPSSPEIDRAFAEGVSTFGYVAIDRLLTAAGFTRKDLRGRS